MQKPDVIMSQLHSTLAQTDEAYKLYAEAKEALAEAKAEKYERTENAAHEVVFVPLECLMDELTQKELESGRFISKLTGRTSKEERAAELEAYMRQTVPAYADYETRLQNQVVNEAMASGGALVAEKDYTRLHTKVMALRGELEFLTQHERVLAANLETDAQGKAHTLAIEMATAHQKHEARMSEQTLEIERMQALRVEREVELAKVHARNVDKELEAANLNIKKEVDNARELAQEEIEKYKEAVQPLLQLAQSLQALNVKEVVEVL